ncbi:MAG: hypothetical protein AAB631_01745 [Patescibacteria group bacterium]
MCKVTKEHFHHLPGIVMAKSAPRLISQFPGLSESFNRYRSFLSRVVMDFAPTHISEHGTASGMIQTIAYNLPQPVARYLSQGTNLHIGFSNRIDVIIRGGIEATDWRNIHFEIVLKTQDSPQPKSTPQPYPLLFKKVGPEAEMEFLTDKTQFQNLHDAIQHGFSIPTAQEIMRHFHSKMLWVRALLTDCDTARLRIIEYMQTTLQTESLAGQNPVVVTPHDPREWDAYCHLSFCHGGECKAFVMEWDSTLVQTRVSRWVQLYQKREKLFRAWGIHT